MTATRPSPHHFHDDSSFVDGAMLVVKRESLQPSLGIDPVYDSTDRRLLPSEDMETLKSTFQDSDEEGGSQLGQLSSKYKLVGRLMRSKAKESAGPTSSPSASKLGRKRSTSSASGSSRHSTHQLEESIAEFFGTPAKPKARNKSIGTSSTDSASSAGKTELKILESALGLGTGQSKRSAARSSSSTARSASSSAANASLTLGREDLVTSRRGHESISLRDDSSSHKSQDSFSSLRGDKEFGMVAGFTYSRAQPGSLPASRPQSRNAFSSAASPPTRMVPPPAAHPPSSARASPSLRNLHLPGSRSASPALRYDVARRPGHRFEEIGSAASGAARLFSDDAIARVSTSSSSNTSSNLGGAAAALPSRVRQASEQDARSEGSSSPSTSNAALAMQRRGRKGPAPSPLPPPRPPPAMSLPPVPCAAGTLNPSPEVCAEPRAISASSRDEPGPEVESRHQAEVARQTSASVATSSLSLPPFRAIVMGVKVERRAHMSTASASSPTVLVELNVGGRRFTTSTATLCSPSCRQGRLSCFIQAEIDKARLSNEAVYPAAARGSIEASSSSSSTGTGTSSTGDPRGLDKEALRRELTRTAFDSSSSEYEGQQSPSDSDYSFYGGNSAAMDSTSSPATILSEADEHDDGASELSFWPTTKKGTVRSITGASSPAELCTPPHSAGTSQSGLPYLGSVHAASSSNLHNDDGGGTLTPDSTVGLPRSSRLNAAINSLLKEQEALVGALREEANPSPGLLSVNECGSSGSSRRTSNTVQFCPSDVGESDNEDSFPSIKEPSDGTTATGSGTPSVKTPTPSPSHQAGGGKTTSAAASRPPAAAGLRRRSETDLERSTSTSSVAAPSTSSSRRKARAAFSLQQVPPRLPVPTTPIPSLPDAIARPSHAHAHAQSQSQSRSASPATPMPLSTSAVVTSLSIFLDRNPKCYGALIDALRDDQLPSGYTMSAASPDFGIGDDLSCLSASSSSCSSSSSAEESRHRDARTRAATRFQLSSVDGVKLKKTATRLAELKKEAAWLGYRSVVDMCEAEQRKGAMRDRPR
ncbi:uncharacterized protein PFL1_02913 [Pseudozyma flocculosa PF-1]|uniref:Uncharacterized protein n=1 Tax=Pseudozyma flocculosa PF-1 TaxID=1277687 RepID=A0A061HAP2_9BASI|nr:uncharacterized protein PFL1_02913 [Pseudozyma flocculosa PF-1]EPQ29693.1 hypothetical protein PFL1_02913 [Pseudozyma flocculosa PF-1]